VTTEGDEEGRATKDLGVHEGYLDEIAFALAPAACYGLRFSAVKAREYRSRNPGLEVNVSLDFETRTWNLSEEERIAYFSEMLEGRPVSIGVSNWYASVKLSIGRSPQERERLLRETNRRIALAKLTKEDIEALGLK